MVVTDLELADAPGIEVLHTCRRMAPRNPVLMCTNQDGGDRERRALPCGARSFVRKWQFESESVRVLLEELLGLAAARTSAGFDGRDA